jgi:hypothetical protein
MAPRNPSPDAILLTRMNMHIPTDTPIRISVLEFPYGNAIRAFLERFRSVYTHQHGEKAYFRSLPCRQLNSAIMALAPSLIHAFEGFSDHDCLGGRMAAFTHCINGTAEDFPSHENLQFLIKTWLELWGMSDPKIRAILEGDGKDAWGELLAAVMGEPEHEWQHSVMPHEYLTNLKRDGGMAYAALPSLLTRLLHGRSMVMMNAASQETTITWRRAHSGDKTGVHLVSQPISRRGSYFAYRLDFALQTQTGRVNARGEMIPWIFAHLSIQRYVTEPLRSWNNKRNVSILVGNNREQICGWDHDTTLIRLPVEHKDGAWVWSDGIGGLLDVYAFRRLLSPELILQNPLPYGGFGSPAKRPDDEYRIVFTEGYKFGVGERGHKHDVPTGMSLFERSSLLHGVLTLLDGWLVPDTALPVDRHTAGRTYALYDYRQMSGEDKTDKKRTAWREALTQSLRRSDCEHLHIAVLYRSKEKFLRHVLPLLRKALLGADEGEMPLVTVTPVPVPPLLSSPLDRGGLDPQLGWSPRAEDQEVWAKQMLASYTSKREAWQKFLRQIEWLPNSRRLALIDSAGTLVNADPYDEIDDDNPAHSSKQIPSSQAIKGAVRDACNREGIGSQFLVGHFKFGGRWKKPDELSGSSEGRIRNAILDLILRQQGILYAPPSEIYAKAAGLDPQIAAHLDVIAFCRLQTNTPKLHYALAVRLRADGTVQVMLPGEDRWLKYEEAAYRIGRMISDARVKIAKRNTPAALAMEKADLRVFVERVLTQEFDRPTIAVIEADKWRDGARDPQNAGWSQLKNEELFRTLDELRFTPFSVYHRSADKLNKLLAVVRVRMNRETPQYVSAVDFASEGEIRDIQHLTAYVDVQPGKPLHYFSVAGLSEMQRKAGQDKPDNRESFKVDVKGIHDDISYKHVQLVEMVTFFVHSDFRPDERQMQLCRCLHYLRVSPGFTMGDIILPYPMHIGRILIEDQLCIVNADN